MTEVENLRGSRPSCRKIFDPSQPEAQMRKEIAAQAALLEPSHRDGMLRDLQVRLKLNRRFREAFGRDSWLLGPSRNLEELDRFLDQARRVSLPVLVLGPPGVGRADAARTLYLSGQHRRAPFVVLGGYGVSASSLPEALRQAVESAAGGTLFISDAHCLEPGVQAQLAEILNSGIDFWWAMEAGEQVSPDVRIVASAEDNGKLLPKLHDELAFLSFDLQPLAARSEDVSALALYFLRHFGRDISELPADLGRALTRYPWPGNISELRRTLGKVARLTVGPEVTMEDLARLAPEVGLDKPFAETGFPAALIAACASSPCDLPPQKLHPALQRTLRYLSDHLSEHLSVAALAREAMVSPSHLSHVFKDSLGLGVIAFVNRVRIERAKRMLAQSSETTISEVAGAVGFNDLRHFERTFKRSEGQTPTSFRRSPQKASP